VCDCPGQWYVHELIDPRPTSADTALTGAPTNSATGESPKKYGSMEPATLLIKDMYDLEQIENDGHRLVPFIKPLAER